MKRVREERTDFVKSIQYTAIIQWVKPVSVFHKVKTEWNGTGKGRDVDLYNFCFHLSFPLISYLMGILYQIKWYLSTHIVASLISFWNIHITNRSI